LIDLPLKLVKTGPEKKNTKKVLMGSILCSLYRKKEECKKITEEKQPFCS
jgi:hypothetical protein